MGELLRKHMTSLSSSSAEYRSALNVLIKYEIQTLLERLSSTGEEAVVITTSQDDGCPGFLGSVKGEKFIEDNKTLTLLHSQLVNYCKDDGSLSPDTARSSTDSNDDVTMDTGPDWISNEPEIMLPSNSSHVDLLPSNHLVSLPSEESMRSSVSAKCRCYGDDCYCKSKPLEPSMNSKKQMPVHPKFSWDQDKALDIDTSPPSRHDDTSSSGKDSISLTSDDNPTIDLTYTDIESEKTESRHNRNSTSQLETSVSNGDSGDVITLPSPSPYNGVFNSKCGFKYPVCEPKDDDTQALDYSMSNSIKWSKSRGTSTSTASLNEICDEKPQLIDPVKLEDCGVPQEFLPKDPYVRQLAYPFLTRELFASKLGPPLHSSELDKYTNELVSETRSAIVEEVSTEKTNGLLNDLYMPSTVKSEPSDDTSECSDMQYISASRLLRHTDLPSSPLQLKFTCKTCGEVFKNRQYRDLHVKLHKNAHKFVCTVCGFGFDQEEDYNSHQKVHCEPLLVCQDCGYRCTREFRMKSHREICGKPSKIYKCPFCNKPFAAKRYMNIHMKSHDVRNVNACPFCPNVYPLKNSLLKHIKKKHDVAKVE